MKKIIILSLFLLSFSKSFSHYLWIETKPNASLKTQHNVKVYFGEYTYGVIEKTNGEAFKGVAEFEVWLLSPSGEKSKLKLDQKEDHYVGNFSPEENGIYTVYLKNDNIDVIDYTEYDFGIFKTYYQSFAKINVGNSKSPSKIVEDGLAIKELPKQNDEKVLQFFFKGKVLKDQEVKVYVSDLWSKTLTTDTDGKINFKLPWNTKYTIETTKNENVPGTYKGEDYEFIWHCATYCFPAE